MISILGPNWTNQLIALVQSAESEIMVTAPYFTKHGVSLLTSNKKPYVSLKVLIGCSLEDFLNRVSDYGSLVDLVTVSDVHHVFGIDAKIYVVDGERAVITFSNLTERGIETNLEIGVLIEDKEATKDILAFMKPY